MTARRIWYVALVIIGALAVGAAELPITVEKDDCPYDPSCDCGAWFTLADYGMQGPTIVIMVAALLAFLASFCAPPSPIPVASMRRRGKWSTFALPVPGFVGGVSVSRTLLCILAGITAFIGRIADTSGPGAEPGADTHYVLALLLLLRPPAAANHSAS